MTEFEFEALEEFMRAIANSCSYDGSDPQKWKKLAEEYTEAKQNAYNALVTE